MNEIKCPHCGKTFTVDESEYASLLSQVKNNEFNEELDRRVAELHKTHAAEQKAAMAEAARKQQETVADKDAEIQRLQRELVAAKNQSQTNIDLAVAKREQELSAQFAQKEQQLNKQISDEQTKSQQVQSQLNASESDKQLAVMKAESKLKEEFQQQKEATAKELQEKQNRIQQLEGQAKLDAQGVELHEKVLKEQYEEQLRMKDELIAQYKDFKTSLSTKMIGESLERYCHNQYDANVRPYLPEAYFDKDNEVIEGTKGDFVFRDIVDGVESVSIMFEMKNEGDDTEKKHKNSDFFNKLDSDRKKKNCEYAVLVTMLELDNDLYNQGIYVVPDREKMYVVRPQQFLAIISLLVQMGRKTIKVKQELEEARNREIDVTHFEEKIGVFKSKFSKHVNDAATRYNNALSDIDKAIEQLTKMKEDLRLWVDHLYKAEGNLDDLTIRKLTYNNPTMKQKFDEASKAAAAQAEEIKD